MKYNNWFLLVLTVAMFTFVSCKEDEDDNALEVPTTYDDSAYSTNTTATQGVIDNFRAIVAEMKNGDGDNNGTISAANANTLLNDGSPSLFDLTSGYYRALLSGWFTEAEAASNSTEPFTFSEVPSTNGVGGVVGAHLFDEHGVEIEQLIDKGLYTAFTYNYAVNTYLTGDVTLEDLDNALALFGAPANFPNAGGSPDKISAIYVSRRDAAGGFYTAVRDNFIKAQAAINQGFPTERDEAVAAIIENWEKGLAATIINYLYGTISNINNGSTDADYSEALHDWAEAVGFLHGFYQVDQTIITDTQIDENLSLINYPRNGTPTPATLTSSATELADVNQAISNLAAIYGFSDPAVFE